MTLRACWLVWLCCLALPAEIIDRIAVSVGTQVITEDQVLEEMRVTAFLNRQPLVMSPETKREAAERLIEQTLMRRDMELTHYNVPALTETAEMEAQVRARYASTAEFQADLRKYGITEDELRQHLWWQLAMLRFIDYRFRPAIQVPASEIKDYYEKKQAEWQKQGIQKIPTLEESRTDIEKILAEQLVDQSVDRWLGDARTRVGIIFHPEAFR